MIRNLLNWAHALQYLEELEHSDIRMELDIKCDTLAEKCYLKHVVDTCNIVCSDGELYLKDMFAEKLAAKVESDKMYIESKFNYHFDESIPDSKDRRELVGAVFSIYKMLNSLMTDQYYKLGWCHISMCEIVPHPNNGVMVYFEAKSADDEGYTTVCHCHMVRADDKWCMVNRPSQLLSQYTEFVYGMGRHKAFIINKMCP